MSILKELMGLKENEYDADDGSEDRVARAGDRHGVEKDFDELIDAFIEDNRLRAEGHAGLVMLATIARGIGYHDQNFGGQLTQNASVGDLLAFIEDNPGAVEAVVEWIKDQNVPEWKESLSYDDDDTIDEAIAMSTEVEIIAGPNKGKSGYVNKVYRSNGQENGYEIQIEDDDEFVDVTPDQVRVIEESVQLDEKVFDNDRYDWFVWHAKKPSKMFDRRGGAKQIEQGMTFGLRAATSKPGTWRLILKAKGPSIIFSIEARDAQALMDAATKLKD